MSKIRVYEYAKKHNLPEEEALRERLLRKRELEMRLRVCITCYSNQYKLLHFQLTEKLLSDKGKKIQ